MSSTRKRIGDLLLERGLVSESDIASALAIQREGHERLGTILVRLGAITETQMLAALSELYEAPIWDLLENGPTAEALGEIPLTTCERLCVLPVQINGDDLILAMRNVNDVEAIDHVAYETGFHVVPVLASERLILAKIEELNTRSEDLSDIVTQAMEFIRESEIDKDRPETFSEKDTAPVMMLVNQMILDAIKRGASDIHVDPCRINVEVRMRIDGQMQTVRAFPSNLLSMVVARIKIMAELDISMRRHPQDGRFNVRLSGKSIDVRVSVLPTHYGERVVMRILDGSVATRGLEELGFSEANAIVFHELIKRPYGLVLVTGPTGSGKTTTLYASLNAMKDSTKTIMTCEDPIEYDVEGVAQSQVNERAGLTFASQLRAIVRQDPDIILVGEIRDGETAQTALRASMTGHLVLSTLHCNDAIGALPRLFDMGVEPYLLSTSLIGVVAQRLVRVLCPDCRESVKPTSSELAVWNSTPGVQGTLETIYRAVGCSKCSETGYKGRVGVQEILPVTIELAALIARKATEDELLKVAMDIGFRSMQADALMRVAKGVTSFAEAKRVVAFNTIGLIELDRAA